MPESSCFRTPFESEDVHRSKTLLEPPLQHFYSNFRVTKEWLSWTTSPLVRFEMLKLCGNTLTADHMYSPHRNSRNRVKGYYHKYPKHFVNFYCIFVIYTKS